MIDRGIGVAGIGLALIFGATQYFEVSLPAWISPTGVGLGIFMLGASVGLVWSGRSRGTEKAAPAERALLRLHIFADNHVPERLADENIFRWYYLSHILVMERSDGAQKAVELPTIFVTFEPEVRITTLKVRSPDMRLPRHEVKEFNQKFAIIVFSERPPEGTLEIRVEK
ncbi:hypothetical protein FRE64_10865 [Euhalothece natronophila Z-M001]|uniref:Uncharacterized protein n=1 Tax=Euhalothece natronophila Z-M001 TaxID=522448 RepID=A0A5B8NM67_9CHRO|nr:hypothetical protein [Euhalothece natronophila]QDZ40413.1 hypothetical protein FRE64_10865 [Euhalothece natronophila Z-M001]